MNALLLLAALAFASGEVELSTGSAVVELPDGRFLLKGPTEVRFYGKGEIRVWEGGLLSAVKKPADIRGKNAAASIKAGELYVEGDYVCVCRGTAELRDITKKAIPHNVTATAHTGTRLVMGRWEAVEFPRGHTDADLIRLGVEPPKEEKKDEMKKVKK